MWEATATTTAEGQVLWAIQALGHPLLRRMLGRPSRILLLRANAYTAQPQTPLLGQLRYSILGQGLHALEAGLLQYGLRPVDQFCSDDYATSQTALRTKEIADNTLVELQGQGQRLKVINADLHEVRDPLHMHEECWLPHKERQT